MILGFAWTPLRQMIYVNGDVFDHEGKIATAPAHDVAHLICAASGLPWRPTGHRDLICAAEYSAVFVEHLLMNTFDAVLQEGDKRTVLARTIEHSDWFCKEHYAPFPMRTEDAIREVRTRLDAEEVARLSPIFFRQRAIEIAADEVYGSYAATFDSTAPVEVDHMSREPQAELVKQLAAFKGGNDQLATLDPKPSMTMIKRLTW